MRVLSDLLLSLAICAWIGGRTALGAFTARILFRKLPRELAAPTMNQIFTEYDWVVRAALVLIVIGLVSRVVTSGTVDRLLLASGAILLALGLFDQLYLAPHMSALYEAGRSGEPEFARLHRLTSASANLELLAGLALFGGMAVARRRA